MSDCGQRHNDPLLAELCEQVQDGGVDPEFAHEQARDMYDEALANGYEGEL